MRLAVSMDLILSFGTVHRSKSYNSTSPAGYGGFKFSQSGLTGSLPPYSKRSKHSLPVGIFGPRAPGAFSFASPSPNGPLPAAVQFGSPGFLTGAAMRK